jgi:Tol biopolymer transport system component
MSIRTLTAATTCVTAALASSCSSAGTPPEHTNEAPVVSAPWILFQQDAGSRQEVAMIRVDGSDRTAPLHDFGTGHQSNPDWSPDGTQYVFAMSDGERDDLWIADAATGHARLLRDCARLCRWLDDPDWSPDGRSIVYSQTKLRQSGSGTATLETVDIVTGDVHVLLGPWRRDFTAGARYSPDGTQVVFEKVHKVGLEPDADIDGVTLSVLRLDEPGHPVRALTDPRLYAATADWSPDGERIAYSGLAEPGDESPDLFWVSPSGGEPTRITSLADDGGFAAEPGWLTDGSGLLFSGHLVASSGSPELLAVALDGSGVGSAFGADTLFGRHPRAQPAP